MRERLLVHLRGLPQIVESWNRPEDNDPQPSQFARSLTKVINIHLPSLHLSGVFASFYFYMVILLEYPCICYASTWIPFLNYRFKIIKEIHSYKYVYLFIA